MPNCFLITHKIMSTQFLYNDDPMQDTIYVLQHINEFTKELGVGTTFLDTAIIEKVIQNIRMNFPHDGGLEKASVFKQVAVFMCHFIEARPILEPFPTEIVQRLARVDNHQNAIIAFSIAEEALHHSKIKRKDGIMNIKNRIAYSKHSYVDIIEALSVATRDNWKLVAVLLEQLTYKTNQECQYKPGW